MYEYKNLKPKLFTEDGQVIFLKVRDNVKRLLNLAGAVRMDEAALHVPGTGDSWTMMACMDRLVELKEIEEITTPGKVAGQHRVFVATGS